MTCASHSRRPTPDRYVHHHQRGSAAGPHASARAARDGKDHRLDEEDRTHRSLGSQHHGEEGQQDEQAHPRWSLDAQYGRASAEVISVVQECKEERWTLHQHEASLAGPTFHDGA